MVPSRRTQPYRKGPRTPSVILTNIRRGRTLHGHNPADAKRAAGRKLRLVRRRKVKR